jgi:hypothetical protein
LTVDVKRRRWLWNLWLGFGVLAGVGALTGWTVSHRLDALLEEHHREVAAILDGSPRRNPARPPILSPTEPGNAWDLLLPAFDALEDLDPDDGKGVREGMAANLDAHGIPAETPRLIEAAGPALEQCRRAARRSDLLWRGPRYPKLEVKAGRAARALCSKALLLWRADRDAEAAEWLIVALTVIYDVVRLQNDWSLIVFAESWALADSGSLLSWQSLTASQLDEW